MLLTLAAGSGWALGNIGAGQASVETPGSNPLHLNLWITTVPVVPLLAVSAVWEGPATGIQALREAFTAAGVALSRPGRFRHAAGHRIAVGSRAGVETGYPHTSRCRPGTGTVASAASSRPSEYAVR